MTERKKSFAGKLSVNILIVTSLIFIGAMGFTALFSHAIISDEATESAKNLLQATINEISATLGRVEEEVEGASWLVEEMKNDPDYLYHITYKLVQEGEISGSSIAFSPYYFKDKYYFAPYSYNDTETGEIKTKQLGNQQYDYFYMDWFQIPSLLGEACWSEPYFDDGGGGFMMTTYSRPLKDENGEVYAVITADVSLEWITERLAEVKPYPSSSLSLVSRCGKYVTIESDTRLQGETLFSMAYAYDSEDLVKVAKDMLDGKSGTIDYMFEKKPYFCVYGPLHNGWSASINCSYYDVLYRAQIMQFLSFVIAILALVILFLVSRHRVKVLTKPIREVTTAALQIADGNFNIGLPALNSGDEIQQLRDSIVFMEDSLTRYIEDLKASTAANERFENELGIASQIQEGMLRKDFPDTDKISCHAILRPAKQVGGDLYDFFFKGEWFYFAIGDVSGKGVPASLFMAITKFAFRLLANSDLELDKAMFKLNSAISEGNDNGMFVTMFIGAINLNTGEFKYCNAGHNPIIVGNEYLHAKSNLAIGLIPDFPYEMEKMQLEKGSTILAYTDGVTEAEREDKEQFTEEGLMNWMNKHEECNSTEDVCECLYKAVKEFTRGNEQNDDITIMTIKYK